MSEEILIRQGAPTLAGIKTGNLFPCPCEDHEALMTDIRKLNRRAVPAAAPLSAGAGAPLPIPPRRTAAGFAGCAGVRAAAMPCQS